MKKLSLLISFTSLLFFGCDKDGYKSQEDFLVGKFYLTEYFDNRTVPDETNIYVLYIERSNRHIYIDYNTGIYFEFKKNGEFILTEIHNSNEYIEKGNYVYNKGTVFIDILQTQFEVGSHSCYSGLMSQLKLTDKSNENIIVSYIFNRE